MTVEAPSPQGLRKLMVGLAFLVPLVCLLDGLKQLLKWGKKGD